jgi:hypothetical protein
VKKASIPKRIKLIVIIVAVIIGLNQTISETLLCGGLSTCGFGHNVTAVGSYKKISSSKPKFDSENE